MPPEYQSYYNLNVKVVLSKCKNIQKSTIPQQNIRDLSSSREYNHGVSNEIVTHNSTIISLKPHFKLQVKT